MKTIRDYITIVENNIDERVTIGADGKPTPSFGDQMKTNVAQPSPVAEPTPAPTNVKSGGAQVEFGGQTYDVMVFGDKSIRPRISGSDKAVSAKVYTMGTKMFVLLDAPAQEGTV